MLFLFLNTDIVLSQARISLSLGFTPEIEIKSLVNRADLLPLSNRFIAYLFFFCLHPMTLNINWHLNTVMPQLLFNITRTFALTREQAGVIATDFLELIAMEHQANPPLGTI